MHAPATPAAARPDPWRSRLLAISSVLLGLIGAIVLVDLWPELTGFVHGPKNRATASLVLTPVLVTAAHVLLGAGAALAFWWRTDPARSRRVLLTCFLLAIPLQVLPRLVPTRWYVQTEPDAEVVTAILLAIGGFADLLPVLLSFTLGMARAGMRRLHLAPDDRHGATFAFVANLQTSLLFSVVAGTVEPALCPTWLFVGLYGALAHYGVMAWLCLWQARRRLQPRTTRSVALVSTVLLLLPGVAMIAHGIWDAHLGDIWLIRRGERQGLQPMLHVVVELVMFAGRSLLTAVAAHDLIATPPGRANPV